MFFNIWHILAIVLVFALGYLIGAWRSKRYWLIKHEELHNMYQSRKKDQECPARLQ